jgi:hypothetical protein
MPEGSVAEGSERRERYGFRLKGAARAAHRGPSSPTVVRSVASASSEQRLGSRGASGRLRGDGQPC